MPGACAPPHGDPPGLWGGGAPPADSAAQHGLTTAQRFDKPGVAVRYGDTIARCSCVFMTAGIHTLLDQSHLPIQGFKDEEHAALSKMAADFDSVVRRYSDLHVRFSLADTDRPKHPAAHPRADSQILDDFTQYFFQSEQPEVVRHSEAPAIAAKQAGSSRQPVLRTGLLRGDMPRRDTAEVQDFGGECSGAPHRRRRANAGVSSDRVFAKPGRQQGPGDVPIGNSQFALDILVQHLDQLCSAKFLARPHGSTPDIRYSTIWDPAQAMPRSAPRHGRVPN